MSLSGIYSVKSYTASASQTEFDYPYAFFADSDIKVSIQSTAGVISTPTFTVAATNGDPSQGATITLSTGAASGDQVTISREVPVTQEYDLQEGSTIDPKALNTAFDRAVAQNQQQQSENQRSVIHPIDDPKDSNGVPTLSYDVPSVANRANKVLAYDSSGNVTVNTFSTVAGDAVTGGNGIDISSNVVSVDNSTDFTFTTGKLALAADSVDTSEIKDNAVTTAKVLNSNITKAKIENVANMRVLGNTSGSAVAPQEVVILDEDTMSSNSATSLATQQSIKAYVDLYKPNVVGNHFKTKSNHVLTNNSNTFVEVTNFQTTITPKVASSKILISGSINAGNTHSGHYLARIQVKVASGSFSDITPIHTESTEVNSHFAIGEEQGDDPHSIVGTGYNFLHTPSYSVGQSLTYTITVGVTDSSSTGPSIYINRSEAQDAASGSNATSSMILQEIYA